MGKTLDLEPRLKKRRRWVTKQQYYTYVQNLTWLNDEVLRAQAGMRAMSKHAAIAYMVAMVVLLILHLLLSLTSLSKLPTFARVGIVLCPFVTSVVSAVIQHVTDHKHFKLEMRSMELRSILWGWEHFGQSFEADYRAGCHLNDDDYWDATTKLFQDKVRETHYRLVENKLTDPNEAEASKRY